MCVKKFDEFIRENYSNYKENLAKYLEEFTIEKEGDLDDDGSFVLEKVDTDYDTEKLIEDKLPEDGIEFIGVFAYGNNMTGEMDEDLGVLAIYYNKMKKEYDNVKMTWDEFSEYFVEE